MKQLIIFLLLIIAFFIGFGKYNQYKRYNSPNVDYKTNKKLDLEYHNQQLVIDYKKSVEDVNSFVMLQWSANGIDVRTPEDDDNKTKAAISKYAEKLGNIKYYESKLGNSANLKAKGLSNKEIKHLEKTGKDLKSYQNKLAVNKIKSMFNPNDKMVYGQKSALIYEVQKKLISKGIVVVNDGIYKLETLNGIKTFEEQNNLFPDGILDVLTLDALFD